MYNQAIPDSLTNAATAKESELVNMERQAPGRNYIESASVRFYEDTILPDEETLEHANMVMPQEMSVEEYEKSSNTGESLREHLDNRYQFLDNERLLSTPLTYDELNASTDAQGRKINRFGHGENSSIHKNWGVIYNIQDPEIIKRLNYFFRDSRVKGMIPDNITARAHPNGKSLIFEWEESETNEIQRFETTARPSIWLSWKQSFGNFHAEEMDWGFYATKDFDDIKNPSDKAETIIHEFTHQAFQIAKEGRLPYLVRIRLDLLKNLFNPKNKFNISDAYHAIPKEKEAYAASNLCEVILEEYDLR